MRRVAAPVAGKLAALLVAAAVTPAAVLAGGARPAAGEPRSVSCAQGGVTWEVDYTWWVSDVGPLVKVDAVWRTDGGGPEDASDETWEWRLETLPEKYPPWDPALPPDRQIGDPFRAWEGPLSPASGGEWRGVEWQSAFYSPRVVTPDGACTLYLAPYANLGGSGGWPKVAVVGDSLLVSLNDPTYNRNAIHGYVEGDLNADRTLAEVDGQSGQGWAPARTPSGLANAHQYLTDEVRGLTGPGVPGVAGVVAALGANDAIRIVRTPADQLAAYRDFVHTAVADALREMHARGGCLALVTEPEHPTGFGEAEYAREAFAINQILRFAAGLSATDSVHLVDFAADADDHVSGPDGWFVGDRLHLNPAGREAYRQRIRQAAGLCTP